MKPFELDYQGTTFTDEQLTNRDLVDVQVLVNDGWKSADVFAGPLQAMSVLAVLVARTTEQPLSLVCDLLADLPAGSIIPRVRAVADASAGERVAAEPMTS